MYTYLLQILAKSPEATVELCRFELQALAISPEPGFLRGTCAIDIADPRAVLIVEEWGNLAAVQAWVQSARRQHLQQQVRELTAGPQAWRTTIYRKV